jgi:hypothetical protein
MVDGSIMSSPGRVLLAGRSAEKVAGTLAERMPVASFTPVALESARIEEASMILLCPADLEDLQSLCRGMGGITVRPGTVICVVAPFRVDLPSGFGPAIVIRSGPCGCDLLLQLFSFGFPAAGRDIVYRQLAMATTGMLLPYFVHNVNNILTRVMGNAELAGLQLADGAKARSRLDMALEGVEELRSFLSRLAGHQAPIGRGYEAWSAGCETRVLEIGRMSSGTSVEFRHCMDDSLPRVLEVDRWELNTLLGCVVAASTICVNGCGSVTMHSHAVNGEARFEVSWTSTSGESLQSDQICGSALLPLSMAAVFSPPAGVTFQLGEWDRNGGSLSLSIPLPAGDRA